MVIARFEGVDPLRRDLVVELRCDDEPLTLISVAGRCPPGPRTSDGSRHRLVWRHSSPSSDFCSGASAVPSSLARRQCEGRCSALEWPARPCGEAPRRVLRTLAKVRPAWPPPPTACTVKPLPAATTAVRCRRSRATGASDGRSRLQGAEAMDRRIALAPSRSRRWLPRSECSWSLPPPRRRRSPSRRALRSTATTSAPSARRSAAP